jgi:LCP family protein required for cell wall assembly
VAAVDPITKKGTILGLPRDSYVDVPGHGKQKINASLALGGPELAVRTVRNLTGFPVSYYAVTGFEGIVSMVDELGGLDVKVEQRMHDPEGSGADFEPGWYHMDGRQVLAFTRDRHDFSDGDFTRSRNQGRVILHTLDKLRAETSDEQGIRHWLGVLYKHGRLDMSFDDAVRLGAVARTLAPADLVNVVASGSARTVNGQSVVVLDEHAYELFRDVGADAVADGRTERRTPPPTAPPTPTPAPSTVLPTPTPGSPTPTPLIHFP